LISGYLKRRKCNFNDKMIEVVSVNTSTTKGEIKTPVREIVLNDQGVIGDIHAGSWHRQVSLLGMESVERFESIIGRELAPGEFAENITTRGIELYNLPLLSALKNDKVELEITQIGKKCHGSNCAIFNQTGACVMPREGIFTRVIRGGTVKAGDFLEYKEKVIRTLIITLSDRASQGLYQDKSGPLLMRKLQLFLEQEGWGMASTMHIFPDEIVPLQQLLRDEGQQYDLIFTTGSTGVGPRDIAPEAIRPMLEKEIPGIMDHIRLKFGSEKPNALLSRSLAGVIGSSLIYLLPGSPRAIEEYTQEIFKTIKHSILMLQGIDIH
jgi:molybdopterin adenylyltransferase